MRATWGRAAVLLAGGLLAGGLVAGCASTSIAGTGGPVSTTPTSGSDGTVTEVPPTGGGDAPGGCEAVTDEDAAPPTTPAGSPMITVTQGTNSWIASDLTQPFAIAVYGDGTAIRAEGQGILGEPLPELTIGRLDPCLLADAVAEIQQLATADLGDATVTDQGTTTIHLVQAGTDVVLDVYALGIGDEFVTDDQRAARVRLTAMIDTLTGGLTQTATWSPDRVRVTSYGNPVDPTSTRTWPLAGPIDSALTGGGRRPCGIFTGADAQAIMTELGSADAGSSWSDGTQTVVLAVGVLVPGQDCSPS